MSSTTLIAGVTVLGCVILAALILISVRQSQGGGKERSWSEAGLGDLPEDRAASGGEEGGKETSTASTSATTTLASKILTTSTSEIEVTSTESFSLSGLVDLEEITELWRRKGCEQGDKADCLLLQHLKNSTQLLELVDILGETNGDEQELMIEDIKSPMVGARSYVAHSTELCDQDTFRYLVLW